MTDASIRPCVFIARLNSGRTSGNKSNTAPATQTTHESARAGEPLIKRECTYIDHKIRYKRTRPVTGTDLLHERFDTDHSFLIEVLPTTLRSYRIRQKIIYTPHQFLCVCVSVCVCVCVCVCVVSHQKISYHIPSIRKRRESEKKNRERAMTYCSTNSVLNVRRLRDAPTFFRPRLLINHNPFLDSVVIDFI